MSASSDEGHYDTISEMGNRQPVCAALSLAVAPVVSGAGGRSWLGGGLERRQVVGNGSCLGQLRGCGGRCLFGCLVGNVSIHVEAFRDFDPKGFAEVLTDRPSLPHLRSPL